MNKQWITWGSNSIVWGNNTYTWSEVYIANKVVESYGGGGGGLLLNKNKSWESAEKQLKKVLTNEEVDKFLRLVVKVNGIDVSEMRELNKVKKSITVEHIAKTVGEFTSNVSVTAVNIKMP